MPLSLFPATAEVEQQRYPWSLFTLSPINTACYSLPKYACIILVGTPFPPPLQLQHE